MNEITTYRWSLFDEVPAYRDAGIDAIGIWRPKLAEFGEERGIELVCDSGLEVSSLSWAGGFTGANGHAFTEAMDDARDALCVASRMNAGALVVVSGSRAGHTSNHARRLLVSALKSLGDLAGACDVPLAVQPMHTMFANEWSFLTSLDGTLDILDACDHPFVRMAFDVYHLWQEPRLLQRIPEIAPFVATVQLNDGTRHPRSELDRCLPGDGEIPLREIVGAFVNAGYRGHYEMSLWSEELWNSDYSQLLCECQQRFTALWDVEVGERQV